MKHTLEVTVIRTAMAGGGTAYDVYWPTQAKPSRPLHCGHIYATVVCHGSSQYYRTVDAIDPRSHWEMDPGFDKWNEHRRLERVAKRLDVRIAKRVFPELAKARELPFLWACWDLPSAEKRVPVRITLPE